MVAYSAGHFQFFYGTFSIITRIWDRLNNSIMLPRRWTAGIDDIGTPSPPIKEEREDFRGRDVFMALRACMVFTIVIR